MLSLLGRLLGALLTLIFIIISTFLALSNPDAVALSLWPLDLSFSVPIGLMILASFGIGLLVGGVAMLAPIMKHRLTIRSLSKELSRKKNTDLHHDDQKPALPTE